MILLWECSGFWQISQVMRLQLHERDMKVMVKIWEVD